MEIAKLFKIGTRWGSVGVTRQEMFAHPKTLVIQPTSTTLHTCDNDGSINLPMVVFLQSEATRFQRTPLSSQCFTTSWGDHWFKLTFACQRFTKPSLSPETPTTGKSPTNSSQNDFLTPKDGLCVMKDSFLLELVLIPIWSYKCDLFETREATLHWGVPCQRWTLPDFHSAHTGKLFFVLLSPIKYFESFESLTIIPLKLLPSYLWISHHVHLMKNVSAVHLLCLSWHGSTVTRPCCRLHSRTKVKSPISSCLNIGQHPIWETCV